MKFLFFALYALMVPLIGTEKALIVSIPKAGTHLAVRICNEIFQNSPKKPLRFETIYWHVQSKHDIEQFVLENPCCKKILMVRNLKDLVVSRKDFFKIEMVRANYPPYLKKHGLNQWKKLTEQEKISDLLRWFREFTQSDFRRHRLEWYIEDSIWFATQFPDALVIRFEDLFMDSYNLNPMTLKKIAEHLNHPEVSLKIVAENSYGKKGTFISQKKLYRHLDEFSEKNLEEFHEIVGELEQDYNTFFNYSDDGYPL